jgi:hypothetical protein
MDILVNILEKHGVWGLLLVVMVFIILKGQFSFQYPRIKKDNE